LHERTIPRPEKRAPTLPPASGNALEQI
jgi:hypothetical protein